MYFPYIPKMPDYTDRWIFLPTMRFYMEEELNRCPANGYYWSCSLYTFVTEPTQAYIIQPGPLLWPARPSRLRIGFEIQQYYCLRNRSSSRTCDWTMFQLPLQATPKQVIIVRCNALRVPVVCWNVDMRSRSCDASLSLIAYGAL